MNCDAWQIFALELNVLISNISVLYNWLYIKVFTPKIFFVFPAISCRIKELIGICAEGFWIMVDFHYEVR